MCDENSDLDTADDLHNNHALAGNGDHQQASPGKAGRKYELQRKIDEELRKLQLADGMEQVNGNAEIKHDDIDVTGPTEITSAGDQLASKVENGQLSIQPVINEDVSEANAGTAVKQNETAQESAGDEPIQPSVQDEIDTPVDSERAAVDEAQQSNNLNRVESDSQSKQELGVQPEGANESDGTESEVATRSSTMTSPTTTMGTFSLPPQSPGTEEDLGEEILPVDQVPPTYRDSSDPARSSPSPLDMEVTEVSSDVVLGQEQTSLKSDMETPANIAPDTRAKENPGMNADAIVPDQTMPDIQNPDFQSESDAGVTALANTNAIVAGQEIGTVEVNTITEASADLPDICATDGEAELMKPATLDGSSIDAEYCPAIAVDETMNKEVTPTESSTAEVHVNESEYVERESEDSAVSLNTNETPVETNVGVPEQGEMESSYSANTNTHDFSVDSNLAIDQGITNEDRKISTDEDDYSGYDIDMDEPSSYQEDFSITTEDMPTEDVTLDGGIEVRPACDSENIPLFADVKYTVGDQINVGVEEDNDKTPTEEKEGPEYPEIVPWDSHGRLREDQSTPIQELSFPSDKAETASSSSKSDLSDKPFDEEASAKIAEETVSNAIKAAYEIACNTPDGEHDDQTATDESTRECENTQDSNYPIHGVETITPDKNEAANEQTSGFDTTTVVQVESLTPSQLAEARENDVRSAGEKVAVVESAKVEREHTGQNASECLVATRVDAELSKDTNKEGIAIVDKEKESIVVEKGEEGQVSGLILVNQVPDKKTIPQQNQTSQVDESKNENLESGGEVEENMVKINDSSGQTRNLPERITYSPALSQRNTEATKWFGQPTSEDKIWMKPLGKVDENAEMERKKLVKAMTRKHNPHLVPKWQPPKEKDFVEDLDEKQKESLKKYEERRRTRSDATVRDESETKIPVASTTDESVNQPPSATSQLPRENIVVESVVHSRDAISIWESRLNEKQQKEKLERQRLSLGKQKKSRERASSDAARVRTDSTSSASSTASGVLPTSEHIERGSMDVSKVRNRWKNIEEESSKPKPDPVVKKSSSGRRSNFSVNTTPAYRSYQSPTPTVTRPANAIAVNAPSRGGPGPQAPQQRESFIDKEIREAAEREEKWKHEQWEKMSEASAASSEDVFPDNIPLPSGDPRVVATVYTRSLPAQEIVGLDIVKDADREDSWKAEHDVIKIDPSTTRHRSKDSSGIGSDIASPPAQRQTKEHKEVDSESLSSYDSSGAGGSGLASPPPIGSLVQESANIASKSSDLTQNHQESNDSGIECSVLTPDSKTVTESQMIGSVPKDEDEARVRRQRITSLTNAVTPKGWEPSKNRAVGPVSPVHRSVPKPEVKHSRLLPVHEQAAVKHESTTISSPPSPVSAQIPATTEEKAKSPPPNQEKLTEPVKVVQSPSKIYPVKNITGALKGGPVVSSSKSRLHAIMEKEMQDAAAREEEWRKKQLELVNQGIDISPHPVVHSTREVRTPTAATSPPPVNHGEPQVQRRKPVKSLFTEDDDIQNQPQIVDDGEGQGKRAVVKSMRMPKRKSQLAMRWEEGQFQNNVPDEKE